MEKSVTQEQIDSIIKHSKIDVKTVFDKVTIVTCKLPNNFVLVESSGSVCKENYDVEMGKKICLENIKNQLWKFEGYSLANKIMEQEGN